MCLPGCLVGCSATVLECLSLETQSTTTGSTAKHCCTASLLSMVSLHCSIPTSSSHAHVYSIYKLWDYKNGYSEPMCISCDLCEDQINVFLDCKLCTICKCYWSRKVEMIQRASWSTLHVVDRHNILLTFLRETNLIESKIRKGLPDHAIHMTIVVNKTY